MTDTQPEHTDTPTEAPPAQKPPTGFHFYDGKRVVVQLTQPYIAGYDDKHNIVGTQVLSGTFRITPGIAPGSLLFLLHMSEQGGDSYVSIYPEDVRHITFVQVAQPNRIVSATA